MQVFFQIFYDNFFLNSKPGCENGFFPVRRINFSNSLSADADAKYRTGARLYFDAEKMARDGLLIRDGFHIKVKDSLPLAPYLRGIEPLFSP